MSIKPTDLFYVDRDGTLYQVSWARIRERELLGTDQLLIQRGDTLYRVAIGDFWDGTKDLDELDVFEVERGDNGILDQNDPGYEGKLYQVSIPIPPFFAIDFISDDGAGGSLSVKIEMAALQFDPDSEAARVQQPDGTYVYINAGAREYEFTQDGIHRFSGAFSRFSVRETSNCQIDASLTPAKTWELLNQTNDTFGEELFYASEIAGTPYDLKVKTLKSAFEYSTFKSTIAEGGCSTWDVSEVTDASKCFKSSNFSKIALTNWDVSNVTNMHRMFANNSDFQGFGIDGWNVANVQDFSSMFLEAVAFNEDISNWSLDSAVDVSYMLSTAAAFNKTTASWVLPNVTNMEGMFHATFSMTQPVFDTLPDGVTSLYRVFESAQSFNQFITWDTKNVTNISKIFYNSFFNQSLSTWDVGNVTDMSQAFRNSPTDDNGIEAWNTEKVQNMEMMFSNSPEFNVDISPWDTSSCTDMTGMFNDAFVFNQDISEWCVSLIASKPGTFDTNSGFQNLSYKQPQWGTCPDRLNGDIILTTGTLRINMTATGPGEILKPDGTKDAVVAGFQLKIYTDPGVYSLPMPVIRQLYFKDSTADFTFDPGFDTKVLTDISECFSNCGNFNGDVANWDVANITNMDWMFYASNFNGDISEWDVGNVTTFFNALGSCPFNGDISNWNVSNVTNLAGLFVHNKAFNGDISNWNTSNVTTLGSTFYQTNFDGDLNKWDTSNVVSMSSVFFGSAFSGNLSAWNTINVETMYFMFENTTAFNSDIGDWVTSNCSNMTNMFHGSIFNSDLSSWCVTLIPAKPLGFDTSSPYQDQTAIQPQWGTCPPRPSGQAHINNQTTPGSVTAEFTDVLEVDESITPASVGTVETQWQRESDIGSGTFVDIAGETGDEYTVVNGDLGRNIRISQSISGVSVKSNEILVTDVPPPLAQWISWKLNTGTETRLMGYVNGASPADDAKIYKQLPGGAWDEVGSMTAGVVAQRVTINDGPGVYVIDSSKMEGFSFRGTREEFVIDERSDFSALTNMDNFLRDCSIFNQNLNWLDTSNVTTMVAAFDEANVFNGNISGWVMTNVTNMNGLFSGAYAFNGDLSGWDTSNVTDMKAVFEEAKAFDTSVNAWNTSKVTTMEKMFDKAEKFNQPLNSWNTSNVTTMRAMFASATSFDSALFSDVSKVENTSAMFFNCPFNQDISAWSTDSLTDTHGMFSSAGQFNYPIGDWNVSLVENFSDMFTSAKVFNQPLAEWDVSSGTNMDAMFNDANAFDQDISRWCVTNIKSKPTNFDVFSGFNGQTAKQPRWGTCPGVVNGTLTLTAGSLKMAGKSAVADVITGPNGFRHEILRNSSFNVTVTDLGDYELPMAEMYELRFQDSSTAEFTFHPEFYTGALDKMTRMFMSCRKFNGDVANWDTSNVTNMRDLFINCHEFNGDLSKWDTSKVTDFGNLFANAFVFNRDLTTWNTTNVVRMDRTFANTTVFNGDISTWDTSNVNNMKEIFQQAKAFNSDINGWETGKVENLYNAFNQAVAFETELSAWDTGKVTNMGYIFQNATVFNSDLSDWDVAANRNFSYMFRNAKAFVQDISTWCVKSTSRKPTGFDQDGNVAFVNNDPIQPQWGSCPLPILKDPVIQAGTGGFGPVDVGDEVILQSTGITDPNGTMTHRWQRETAKDSGNWVDIAGQTNINYITTDDDADLAVRIVETHTAGDRVQDIPSNAIEVEVVLPVDPTRVVGVQLTSGTLNIKGNKTGGGIIYHVDSSTTIYTMPSGSFSTSVSTPGLYLIESIGLTALNFDESKTAVFQLDTRSYMNDIVNAADMFYNCWEFDQDLTWWNVSNVTNMAEMFGQARKFNTSLSGWNTGKVTNMAWMFYNCRNMSLDLSGFNVSNVTNFSRMFHNCLKQTTNVSGWNVGKGQNFEGMFYFTRGWNAPVGSWNMANATNLSAMFYNADDFNYDISGWNTGKVTNMSAMFAYHPNFNIDIGPWNVSNVVDMKLMFQSATRFNQDLSGWCVSKIGSKPSQFDTGSGFYNQTPRQPQWGTCPPKITSNPVIY